MPVVLPKVFLLQAVYDMYGNILEFLNSWVARDVTKNQTKKLSILLSFYFHGLFQYLNNLHKQIFGSKGFFVLRERTLEFPGFCVTRRLAGGRESSYVG